MRAGSRLPLGRRYVFFILLFTVIFAINCSNTIHLIFSPFLRSESDNVIDRVIDYFIDSEPDYVSDFECNELTNRELTECFAECITYS